jgi:plastocyanin
MGRVRSKRRVGVWMLAAVAVLLAVPASAGASVTITLGDDNRYAPETAALDLGDGSFDWQWGPGGAGTVDLHNVIQDDALFSSGDAQSSRPGGYSVTASAGTYPYFCSIHFGMEGVVSVRPVLAATDAGEGPIRVSWAAPDTMTGSKYDVRYRSGKKWKPWLESTKKLSGTFGKRKPKVKAGRSYRFEVRSRSGKKHRSDWSPQLVVAR